MRDLEAVVQRCQAGELAAFTELFRAHEAPLYRLALVILRQEADAQDALQETWLKVFRQIKDYRGAAALRTWLTTILVNVCRDHLRRARLRRMQPLEWLTGRAAPVQADVAEAVQAALQRGALFRCVDQLDDKHRLPVILFYLEELSGEEVAAVLGLPARTVYSRLQVARERLRGMLRAAEAAERLPWEGDMRLC